MLGKMYPHGLSVQELDGILSAHYNLMEYLYNRYGEYESIRKEVLHMVETFIDPQLVDKGRREGKREGKLEGK